MQDGQQRGVGQATFDAMLPQTPYSGLSRNGIMEEYSQDVLTSEKVDRGSDSELCLPSGQGNFAYELLLLQQRLLAYEQLHQEEMAELRQEIERLRCAFLQETNPQLRSLTPNRKLSIRE